MSNNTEVLAYLAGYFDGEGTVGMYPPDFTIRVAVGSTIRSSVDEFASVFGGSVVKMTRPSRPHIRQVYEWHAYGKVGQAALEAMLPFLRLKKEQAIVALSVPAFTGRGRHRAPSTSEVTFRAEAASNLVMLKRKVV